jgi:hypothetical protein
MYKVKIKKKNRNVKTTSWQANVIFIYVARKQPGVRIINHENTPSQMLAIRNQWLRLGNRIYQDQD